MPFGVDHPAPERLAQVRDVALKRLGRRRRRTPAPQLVDQALAREHRAAVQHQDRQHAALLGPAQRPRIAALDNLEHAKDTNLHGLPPFRVSRPYTR